MSTEEVKPAAEEVKKDAKAEEAEPKTPPVEDDEEKEETPTKGKRKKKETTPKKEKKEPAAKKEKKTTPKKETTPAKRKESPGGLNHTMETRTRKKAREAVDMVVGGPQRNESLINFLGSDYDQETYKGPSDAELKMMFRVFDRDNDGHIGSDELAEVLRSMGKRPLTKKIQKMLDECDSDKNGTIELEEFITYMRKKAAKKAETLRNKGKGKKEAEEEKKEETPKKGGKGKKAAAKGGKGKKAAGKKAAAKKDDDDESDAEPEASSSSSPAKTTTTTAETTPSKPARGASILDFYTAHAGLQEADANAPVDKYNNPEGAQYDLGVEGAFTAYKILAGLFYDSSLDNAATVMTPADFTNRVGGALKSKGFQFETVSNQKEFISKIHDFDEAWIISNKVLDTTTTPDEFTTEVVKFHDAGGGLFLWGDNTPWVAHANLVLEKLFATKLTGNNPADKIIQVGDNAKAGFFSQHLITSGIKFLFEGRTVSYPEPVPATLKTLALSTDNSPVILHSDNTKLAPTAGRVVVDCGFTKLWVQWDSAGTERYVKNASVWLLGIDNRLAIDAPLTGKLQKQTKAEKPVWQFKHGGWHDYDSAAAQIVEKEFLDWQQNQYLDVRSVKSGVWHYMVDFRNMKQTNIEHQAHTQRDVRRIMKEVYL